MALANRSFPKENPFVPAVKEQVHLRVAVTGPPGSGKTWVALQMATAIVKAEGGKIAVIDTEGRSARRYAGIFKFDVLDLADNYDPELYVQAIASASHFGYTVLVIDSFSHAWNGPGGVLNIVDRSKMGNNKMSGWIKGRPAQDSLTQAILNAKIHLLGTMRSKTEWAFETDAKGKQKPVKLGVGSVQSQDFEYEFDVAMLLDMDHTIHVTKSRCLPLNTQGETFTDAQMVAETLHTWATDGEEQQYNQLPASTTYLSTENGKDRLKALLSSIGASGDNYPYYLNNIEPDRTLTGFSDTYLGETELHNRIKELAKTKSNGGSSSSKKKPGEDIRMFRTRLKRGIDSKLTDAEICKYAEVSEFTSAAILEKHGDLPTAYDAIEQAFIKDMSSPKRPAAKAKEDKVKPWTEDQTTQFESKLYLTYPDDADDIMDNARPDLEVEHWHDLGAEDVAWQKVATYCYDKQYKVVAEHVKLVKSGKRTYLLFQTPIPMRFYGHTSIKEVVGEMFFEDNGIENLEENKDFVEIEALRIDEYEKKGEKNPYYILKSATPLIENVPDAADLDDYFSS
jgi:hypothetical protein